MEAYIKLSKIENTQTVKLFYYKNEKVDNLINNSSIHFLDLTPNKKFAYLYTEVTIGTEEQDKLLLILNKLSDSEELKKEVENCPANIYLDNTITTNNLLDILKKIKQGLVFGDNFLEEAKKAFYEEDGFEYSISPINILEEYKVVDISEASLYGISSKIVMNEFESDIRKLTNGEIFIEDEYVKQFIDLEDVDCLKDLFNYLLEIVNYEKKEQLFIFMYNDDKHKYVPVKI